MGGGRNEEDSLDVIQESPPQVNAKLSKSRSRLLGTTNVSSRNREHSRRQFRKSKSDSSLAVQVPAVHVVPPVPHSNNYSEFFRSEFSFPESQEVLKGEENRRNSYLTVSQIQAAFANENVADEEVAASESISTSANLDTPIFSDDVAKLMHSEDANELWQDSLHLSALPEVVEDADQAPAEENFNFDASSFIGPARELGAAELLTKEIDQSHRELREIELSQQPVSRSTFVKSFSIADNLSISSKSYAEHAASQHQNLSTTQETADLASADLETLKHISAWNLPQSILREYDRKGVVKMFDWQIECLRNPKVLFGHRNLVYSAPTSAGKTLVSEILLLKTVLERNKKVLLILPFISVVREKMFYLQDLLTPSGYRVEGFFGGYTPPGGFDNINVAICTIEKANSIVNKLMESHKLDVLGTVIVDEVHLISDPGRGYILELLLAKILYMCRKYGYEIQVITMSATLANVELLKCWLDAELFITNFRPVELQEMVKIGNKIFDANMKYLRDVAQTTSGEQEPFPTLKNDSDHVAQLCLETVMDGCSVIVFCPSKDWCEKLALQLAGAIHTVLKGDSIWAQRLRLQLNQEAIEEVKKQLRDIPTGLDDVLERTVTYACAFHHAGLTTEERDIVEASFKAVTLKIIVATSTLSSGVNLPARRVVIRSPLFGGKQMSSLTYRQMIGRAGRTGKDTMGESILICTEANARVGRELVTADLRPISSCLEMDSSTHLKRALLEVISSGVVSTKDDIERFVNSTLLSTQKQLENVEKDTSAVDNDIITDALKFLVEYEFVRLQLNEETCEENYMPTRLGMACLASSMPPTDGLILFSELQKSRRCFVLESELHAVYLVTPYSVCYQLQDIDWLMFLDLWEKLSPAMKKVGELVGVKESFLVRAMRGQSKLDYKLLQIHKRFYTALALQELVNETPINQVAIKYKCTRGMLQSLQQMASTFAGIVTAFCNSLQWSTLSLVVSQFKERLFFGIHRDLIDLMRLPDLSHKRARTLFDAGITSVVELANTDVFTVEKVLYNSLSFDSAKQQENEDVHEAEKRKSLRNFFITGKTGLTVAEAAKLFVEEARQFVQYELGVDKIKWIQQTQAGTEDSGSAKRSIMHPKRISQEVVGGTPPKTKKLEGNITYVQNGCEDKQKARTNQQAEEPQTNQMQFNGQSKNFRSKMHGISGEKESTILNTGHGNKTKKNLQTLMKVTADSSSSSLSIIKTVESQSFNKTKLAKDDENKVKVTETKQRRSNSLISKAAVLKEVSLRNSKDLCAANAKNRFPNGQCGSNTKFYRSSKENIDKNASNSKKEEVSKLERKSSIVCHPNDAFSDNCKQNQSERKVCPAPRRSPRNHVATVKKGETKAADTVTKKLDCSADMAELFMNTDSFDLNMGISDALIAANRLTVSEKMKTTTESAHNNSVEDHIPSSQSSKKDAAPTLSSPTQKSRFLRSNRAQKLKYTPRQMQKARSLEPESFIEPKTERPAGSSIELSDLSMDSSLIRDPALLNASHILSCSKTESDSVSFKCVQIVDICGNHQLFKDAFKELTSATRFGFSIGLQQQPNKRKPLIGSKILLNSAVAAEAAVKETEAQQMLFEIDDSTYVAGVAFAIERNVVYYMNLQTAGTCAGITTALKSEYLRMLLREKQKTLQAFDSKEQLKILRKSVCKMDDICVGLEDPKISNWLLQPDTAMSLQQMTQQFAPECTALVNLCGSSRSYNSIGLDPASSILARVRCSVEACVTMHILKNQIENLERIGGGQLYKFFTEIEMPLQLSLCNMEIIGFPVIEQTLQQLFQEMTRTAKKLETNIFKLHGARFNLSSSAAVARVLGCHRKTNGRISTSRQILEKIDSPISQMIVTYRKLSATMSNNIQPLLKCVEGARIHGQSITCTATGRISMAEPNLQNIAKDFDVDLGNERCTISCRKAFAASNVNRCLISIDFCQLEMRILAHLSQDAALLQVMHSEQDVFTAVAARWNGIAESEVSEQLRNGTKQICYGIIYGMGMRSLSEALKCTEQEATQISEQFHAVYPGIRVYAGKIIKFARVNGYVETITGRRRYLYYINSEDPQKKKQAERQAVNTAIQGSAADIAKSAILRIEKNIEKYRSKLGLGPNDVCLVLHLHDELIFEVPIEKAKKVAKVLSVTMEKCVTLSVPLRVKLKIGSSWGELKVVKL